MEEILHHPKYINFANNGINYQPQLVSRISFMNSITSKSLIKSLGNLFWTFVQAFQPNNLPTFNPIPSLPHSSLFCQCHLLRFKLIKKSLSFFTKTNPKKWRFFFGTKIYQIQNQPTKLGGGGKLLAKTVHTRKLWAQFPIFSGSV